MSAFHFESRVSVKNWLFLAAQEQDTRNISEEEEPEMNYQERTSQKRKYPSSEEQFVQIDAVGSLVNVNEEHVGDNNGNIKEAIVIDISDDDE